MLLLLLSGCGVAPPGTGASGATEGEQSTSVATTGPTTMPEPAATSDTGGGVTTEPAATPNTGVVVTWTRSGGIAGIMETMTVYSDGRVTLDRDGRQQTVQGDMAVIRALEQTLAGAEWQSLDPVYGEQFPDAFAYSVQGGGKEVRTYDGAQNPAPLVAVLQQLDQLYQAASNPQQ